VVIRDIQYFVSIMVFILIILSPIAYTIDMLPEHLRLYLSFNPLFYFVISYQEIMMFGRIPPLSIFIPMVLFSIFSFLCGYFIFNRMKPTFSDYL
jgi:ABC-type polysaccharide/polyol phosphate export permease